jgi:hypothetical protein
LSARLGIASGAAAVLAAAGTTDVIAAKASCANDIGTFTASVRHADTGYARARERLAPRTRRQRGRSADRAQAMTRRLRAQKLLLEPRDFCSN